MSKGNSQAWVDESFIVKSITRKNKSRRNRLFFLSDEKNLKCTFSRKDFCHVEWPIVSWFKMEIIKLIKTIKLCQFIFTTICAVIGCRVPNHDFVQYRSFFHLSAEYTCLVGSRPDIRRVRMHLLIDQLIGI